MRCAAHHLGAPRSSLRSLRMPKFFLLSESFFLWFQRVALVRARSAAAEGVAGLAMGDRWAGEARGEGGGGAWGAGGRDRHG